jgi:hypothetical protein
MAMSRVVAFPTGLILAAAIGVLPTQGAGALPPPTTFVGIPSNNATVSGTSQLLDAGASSGAIKVQFEITGGTLTDQIVATPTYFGWLAQWNTTTVADGTYQLQSVASYSGAVSVTSAPITVTVTSVAPSVLVVLPASGADLATTQQIVIDALASPGVTAVTISVYYAQIERTPILIQATPTIYGWIGIFPAAPPCGLCIVVPLATQIQAEASYSGGVSGVSPIVNVTLEQLAPTV